MYTIDKLLLLNFCMSAQTKTKIKSITTPHIIVATFAAFAAGSVALATVPMQINNNIAQSGLNCVAQITSKTKPCTVKKAAAFREYRYTCPNGKKFRATGVCRTEKAMLTAALKTCTTKKYCVAVVPPATPENEIIPLGAQAHFPDLAFLGRPEENVHFYTDSAGNAKMRVHYSNRGDVPLVEHQTPNVVRVTFLNAEQQADPSRTPQTQPLALLAAGKSFDTVVTLNQSNLEGARFVKVELVVSGAAAGTSDDQNQENNSIIVEIPTAPFVAGEDLIAASYADLIPLTPVFEEGVIKLDIKNQGNIPSTYVAEGITFRWKKSSTEILKVDTEPVLIIGAGDSNTTVVPIPEGNPTSVEIELDPNGLLNEPRDISPNPILENNKNVYLIP